MVLLPLAKAAQPTYNLLLKPEQLLQVVSCYAEELNVLRLIHLANAQRPCSIRHFLIKNTRHLAQPA